MKSWRVVVLAVTIELTGCGGQRTGLEVLQPMPPALAAAIEGDARAYARAVARDVTREGPAAWHAHFENAPEFFMAADGRVVFATGAAAMSGIEELTHSVRQIVLEWGEPLRVDALAPGLAMLAAPYSEIRVDVEGRRAEESGFFTGLVEYRNERWQFRDAHWSTTVPQQTAQ